jgi:hypothetical protein
MRCLTIVLLSGSFLLLVLSTAQAQVQPTFNTAPQYPGGFPVAIADFNLDGKLDIVSGASVLLGNGDGTFRTGTPLNVVPQYIYYIATADFNGDGKPDIAFLNAYNGTGSAEPLQIFLGNGDGTFQSPINITPSSSFTYFVVADVNNDGKPDLLTVDGGALHVYLGKGDGTFTSLAPNLSQSVQYVGDFNGDGKVDILWPSSNQTSVNVALGNGDGTFQSPVLVSSLGGAIATVADFNRDGKLDLGILVGSCNVEPAFCTWTFAVQLGNGDGTFQAMGPQISIPPDVINTPGTSQPGLAVGDVNGDGIPDVAYAPTGPILGILTGNGDGTFAYGNSYALASPAVISGSASPNSIAIADLNGDHKLDIVEGQRAGNISVLIGNGNGSFAAPPALDVAPVDFPGPIVSADFNGDGKPDAAIAGQDSSDNAVIAIFLDTASGLVQNGSLSTGINSGVFAFFAADLNHDGKQDLLAQLSPESGAMVAFLGNGNGTFGSPLTLPLCGPSSTAQALGDFNGDGMPDLVTTGGPSALLYVCLGKGDGTFGAATQYLAGPNPGPAVLGDFNGDGKLDIAVLNPNFSGASTVGILLGKGDGTFQPVTFPISNNNALTKLAVADVNLDGKLDLITGYSNGSSQYIQVYLGNGDGTFQALPAQVGSAGAVADLNGDGIPDLLSLGNLCLGRGDGTFSCQVFPYGGSGYGGGIVIADFNGDGKPDIAMVDSYDLAVLTNTTAQTFTISASALSPSSVSPGSNATTTVTIGSIFAFKDSVTLSCSSITLNGADATNKPPTCSFSPATLTTGSGASTLTVSTTGPTATLMPYRVQDFRLSYAVWLPMCGIVLFGAGPASRRSMVLAVLLVLALGCLIMLPACGGGSGSSNNGGGGGGGSSGTPSGTYTITVMASATGVPSQTTTLTLTVK